MKPPSRRFRQALVASLVLNLIALLIFASFVLRVDDGSEGRPAVTERLAIEHRPKPTPQPTPRHTTVVVRPTALPHQEPRPRAVALGAPKALAPVKPIPHRAPKIVAKLAPPVEEHVEAPHAPPQPRRLSETQIAAITQNLASDIAADKQNENPLHVDATAAAGGTMKHYGFDASQFEAGGVGHEGDCSPVKSWTDGGWNYYYLSCYVRASDGTVDQEGIPWPVRFHPNDDPFDGTGRAGTPVAMPLPGWHLPPGEPVADGVRQYALEHGVTL